MAKKISTMDYQEMRSHVGHNIELSDVVDWNSNKEIELEIRCKDCEGCEPILNFDNPKLTKKERSEIGLDN